MIWLLIFVSVTIVFVISMYIQSYKYKITYKTLHFPELPSAFDETKVLFISDIHRRNIPCSIIECIRKNTSIDYVFIGGDLVEEGVQVEQVKHNIHLLRSLGPTFFVWGNHDLKYDVDELTSILKIEGVKILNNEAVLLQKNSTDHLWIIGVEDVCSKKDQLEKALQATFIDGGFRILLSHVPTITRKITPEHRIALVLSGHTHGGQIALPFFGPITGAVGQIFPKQVVGYHELDHTKLYISSGFGTSHFPLRLLTTPEMVVFTLKTRI